MNEIFSEALISMGANKLRSFLTTLGIIIGVSSVVLMLAIGQGSETDIKKTIASMGSNLLVVLSGYTSLGGIRGATGSSPTLNISDAKAINELSEVAAVAPAFPGSAQIIYEANNWSTTVLGCTPEFLIARDWPVIAGRPFTEKDMRSASLTALLGLTVKANLFGNQPAVGKTIRIKNIPFEVIGILGPKGQTLEGRDSDDVIMIPFTTAQRKVFGTPYQGSVRFMLVKVKSPEAMYAVETKITQLLRERHRIKAKDDNDFTIRNLSDIAQGAQLTARIMSLLLGSVAAISLVVGGIGIMNIMIVSVTERTREIGIRKAIGATERSILLQFFAEAIFISSIGSIIGLLLGVGSSLLVSTLFEITVQISVWSIFISIAVALLTGIFFGFYPAQKAAKMNPIEALRYQ